MAEEVPVSRNKLQLSLDLRVVCLLLAAALAVMLFMWKPWDSIDADTRTIRVTGESTLKAEPDEYLFSPTYEVKNPDKDAALKAVTEKSDSVIAGLKDLGVDDSQIKSSAYGDNYRLFYPAPSTDDTTYNLQLTVTVGDRELAQKVQDYLITTTPTGTVTPQATFSDKKRGELESQARDEATKEARSKADQSAKNLGFKVGKVKAVEDGTGFGEIMPMDARSSAEVDLSAQAKLSVQPGENELNYSVTVTYYLR